MFETNVSAMKWVLESLKEQQKKVRVVFTSSGAVYGAQDALISHVPETYLGAPDVLSPGSAYAEGKRVAEFLLAQSAFEGFVEAIFARLFAFSGPGLPLDRHFAIGNFVADAINRSSNTLFCCSTKNCTITTSAARLVLLFYNHNPF